MSLPQNRIRITSYTVFACYFLPLSCQYLKSTHSLLQPELLWYLLLDYAIAPAIPKHRFYLFQPGTLIYIILSSPLYLGFCMPPQSFFSPYILTAFLLSSLKSPLFTGLTAQTCSLIYSQIQNHSEKAGCSRQKTQCIPHLLTAFSAQIYSKFFIYIGNYTTKF